MVGLEPEPPAWVRAGRDATDLYHEETAEPVFWLERDDLDVQIATRKGRCSRTHELVQIAVMLQIKEPGDDAWVDVYRCDSSHDYVHEHFDQPLARTEDHITLHVPENCRENLDAAFAWAIKRAHLFVDSL